MAVTAGTTADGGISVRDGNGKPPLEAGMIGQGRGASISGPATRVLKSSDNLNPAPTFSVTTSSGYSGRRKPLLFEV